MVTFNVIDFVSALPRQHVAKSPKQIQPSNLHPRGNTISVAAKRDLTQESHLQTSVTIFYPPDSHQ